MGSQADILSPPEQTLTIAGEELEVMPLTIGRLGAVMRALGPVVEDLRAGGELDLARLVSRYSGEAIDAVAAATGKGREWVESLPPDEFMELAGLLVEVNADFFSRYLEPSLKRLTGRLTAAAGRISSQSSSGPGSDSVM